MISGNCGNQFFQYAFARNLQHRIGGELYIDYTAIHNDMSGYYLSGSDNLLSDYNTVPYHYVGVKNKQVNWKIIIIKLLDKIVRVLKLRPYTARKYKFVLWCAQHLERFGVYYFTAPYYPYKYYSNKNIIISGYFESVKYFENIDEQIKKELSPRHELLEQNIELYDIISNRQSVCVSIKRRDIENKNVADVYGYDMNYFYNAVKYIKNKVDSPVFVVFSDNVEWCKANFKIDAEVYYETSNNPIWEKIRLMSGCKHFIIHNSTFSWWAQHLSNNRGKIVISPTVWIKSEQPIDIYEDNWIYMTNNGDIKRT